METACASLIVLQNYGQGRPCYIDQELSCLIGSFSSRSMTFSLPVYQAAQQALSQDRLGLWLSREKAMLFK